MMPRNRTLMLLQVAAVAAFRDTSPFFLFSTSTISLPKLQNVQILGGAILNSALLKCLASCPSESYILATQPGVEAADFAYSSLTPYLTKLLNASDELSSTVVIPEITGGIDGPALEEELRSKCKATVVSADATVGSIPAVAANPRILKVDFSKLPHNRNARNAKIRDNDSFFNAILSTVEGEKFTVFYMTSPPSKAIPPPVYEMDAQRQEQLHMDLKRNLLAEREDKGSTKRDDRPLFEKYVYFSTGIFMGLIVFLLVLTVIYIALNALGSLQVSYCAFSKEMGQAGKKQQ